MLSLDPNDVFPTEDDEINALIAKNNKGPLKADTYNIRNHPSFAKAIEDIRRKHSNI